MHTRPLPILAVGDVLTEKALYGCLGFEPYINPTEIYPGQDFAALKDAEHRLFGLMQAKEPFVPSSQHLIWQIETPNLGAVYALALKHSLEILTPPTLQSWGQRTMHLRSPGGYEVGFEEAS